MQKQPFSFLLTTDRLTAIPGGAFELVLRLTPAENATPPAPPKKKSSRTQPVPVEEPEVQTS